MDDAGDRDVDREIQSCAINLRAELSLRGLRFAETRGLQHERTDGNTPGIIFGTGEDGRHGNFHPRAYQAIVANVAWKRRLGKVHTASKRVRARADWKWKELDCANSSDALLMNIFCYPGVVGSAKVRGLLGIEEDAAPEFGYKPRTPLRNGKSDNTEIDMRIGDLLVEAKLTESGFQTARPALIQRYRDLEDAFEVDELPMCDGRYAGYQLIRGALAAYAAGASFCVCCDARRPALAEMWYRVLRAVRPAELRCRLKLLTWQELASALSRDLQRFLEEKYGIALASRL
ncbi:MAG TPA: hypothetical protein VMD97_02915 [Candidatus Aquilonibacter sp.]|nr:hypothetical protein [Candidatus Aquilonibacter sp.]